MKVSLNTIKEFTDVNISVDELVTKINAQLGGVEEVIDLSTRYDGATIVKVVACEKHPNADKLSVCKVDDGSGELTQVVCGAPNVREGMFAVWLKPGMVVPSTASDDEPFVLGARELRGVMSNGMLAAGDELAINNDHDGIVEITERDLAPGKTLQAGASFAETFDLNDTIIDIENKMFTHRPDLFGQLGVAREIAGIQGQQFEDPDWYWSQPVFTEAKDLALSIFNETPDKVHRLMAVAMTNVTVAPSPLWLQTTLMRWGGKSINNVVDMTNYVMLLTAQPTHAYDYDKLQGNTLGARMAKAGEKILLLNGKTYELTETDIVMADAERVVGLAGVMGGSDTEVDETTTNIVLEVANFDMYAVRKSAMRHGVFTDALTRFNKGQSPLQNNRIIARLMQGMTEQAGAKQASNVQDDVRVEKEKLDSASMSGSLRVAVSFINERLGLDLDDASIGTLLRNVHFACYTDDDGLLNITAPFWRTDIDMPEDIVEEVGRLYGFDKLPRALPLRSSKATSKNPTLQLKQRIRDRLKAYGANEVLTYSFVHEKVLTRAEQKPAEAFRLSNALSPDLQYYRLSILPSLLDKVHPNIKSGFNEFVLFELGKGHNKQNYDGDLPTEVDLLELVYAAKHESAGAPFYQMRRIVQQLTEDLNIAVEFTSIDQSLDYAGAAMFDQQRSALVKTSDGEVLGIVGEFKDSVQKNFKLPSRSAGASFSLNTLQAAARPTVSYVPLSRYPSVTQDISLKVAADCAYQEILNCGYTASEAFTSELRVAISPVAIYQPAGDNTKTITLRFMVTSHDKTLTDEEVKKVLSAFADKAKQSFAAVVV